MTDLKQKIIFLAVTVGLCYLGSLSGGFHFDDSHSVQNNLSVRSLSNIPSFWTDSRTSSVLPDNRVYRPLVYTFYSFCWLIGKGQTWPFHIMKMAMHFFVCVALMLIWRRLWQTPGWFPLQNFDVKFPMVKQVFRLTPEWVAFFVALLFAVHPANSECVDYISATTSLQCAMFYVWAFYFYLLYRDHKHARYIASSILFYFLSVASKEEGVTLPAMVFITEIFLSSGGLKKKIFEGIKFSLPWIGTGIVLAIWVLAMRAEEGNLSRGFHTPWEYFMTQWRAYLWYMRLWYWPWGFDADSATMTISSSITQPYVIQSAIGNVALLLLSWGLRKKIPAFLYGLAWFYVTISPASSVVVLAEAVNEHRMYLAYVGFVGGSLLLLLWMIENLSTSARTNRVGWVYAFILCGLVIGTQERNRVWHDEESLWADVVEKNPTSGRALNNMALVFMGRGDYTKAISLYNDCERYWSTYPHCPLNRSIAHSNLGNILKNANKDGSKAADVERHYSDAERDILRAYSIAPQSMLTNYHLAKFYLDVRQNYEKAAQHFKTTIQLSGGRHPDAETNLAICNMKLKKFDDAVTGMSRAISMDPENEGLLFENAKMLFEMGKFSEATDGYEKLLKLNPWHLGGWYNYGVAQIARTNFQAAKVAFEKTVIIDPKSEQGWYNLAFVSERLGDKNAALMAAEKLLTIRPDNVDFQNKVNDLKKKVSADKAS
jgi:tetratricopeptide (TPR) repeat protein